MRTYTELNFCRNLEERFDYLALGSQLGLATFGFDRWLNQMFYRSKKWRDVRTIVRARDEGRDLGDPDTIVMGNHVIHHMNPITLEDIETGSDNLIDPEYLITCALRTHNAVHFGNKSLLPKPYVERQPWDTVPWRH